MHMLKVNASASTKPEQSQRPKTSWAAHVFCSIFTCTESNTNDSALLQVSLPDKRGTHMRKPISDETHQQKQQSCGTENSRKSSTESRGKRAGSANYVRVRAPNCSQCKKPFVPEKLHSHMQSCKALNGRRFDDDSSAPLACGRESQGKQEFSSEAMSIGYLTY